jgi:hypothetical protein
MAEKELTSEQVLSYLAETPRRIAERTEGLEPEQLRTASEPDAWSANDVLAHLRCCADVWGSYMARILAEDRPAIRAVSPRRWIERTDYPDLEFGPSFEAFGAQREELLVVLEALPPAGWSRAAVVTGVGRPIDRTVLNYAERLARHERSHCRQIESIVAALHGGRLATTHQK